MAGYVQSVVSNGTQRRSFLENTGQLKIINSPECFKMNNYFV